MLSKWKGDTDATARYIGSMLWHPARSIQSNSDGSASRIRTNIGWTLKLRKFGVSLGLGKTITLIGFLNRTALKQPVPPTSVAKSILFLASEAWSGHVTGQILNVDCGKQGKVMWMKQETAESNGL